jgi:hypothetical protein
MELALSIIPRRYESGEKGSDFIHDGTTVTFKPDPRVLIPPVYMWYCPVPYTWIPAKTPVRRSQMKNYKFARKINEVFTGSHNLHQSLTGYIKK